MELMPGLLAGQVEKHVIGEAVCIFRDSICGGGGEHEIRRLRQIDMRNAAVQRLVEQDRNDGIPSECAKGRFAYKPRGVPGEHYMDISF